MSFQQYFVASGWTPRAQTEAQARQALRQWLTGRVRGGALGRRAAMAPSPWEWEQVNNPRPVIRNTPVRGPRDLHYRQTLWNFMEIPGIVNRWGRPATSKGYVTCRDVLETPHRELGGRGAPEGPFRGGPRVRASDECHFKYWEVVRRMPDTEAGMRNWGYQWSNATERQVILGYCRQYNATLRARLVAGYSAGRAHSSAVSSIRVQSRQLIWQALFDLALSVGGGQAGMNFAPFFGDFASKMRDIQTR